MFSIDMFNEGLHLPDVDGVILLRPTQSDRIDSDDPVMSAADDAEVKLLEDIKANGVQVVVTRDRRGNVRKTNMTGVAYDMIQRIKNNRRSGNNNVY